MYSVGYAGYYGLSIGKPSAPIDKSCHVTSLNPDARQSRDRIRCSSPVLSLMPPSSPFCCGLRTLVSVRYGHAKICGSRALAIDIERIYGGGKKPLAGMPTSKTEAESQNVEPAPGLVSQDRTPSVTDGQSAASQARSGCFRSSAIIAGETDNEWDRNPDLDTPVQETIPQLVRSQSQSAEPVRLTMRELSLQYLQRPAIIFANIDLFR